MDDHMIDRIATEIKQCFSDLGDELQEGERVQDNVNYKSAAALIKAHNALVRLLYFPQYIKANLKGSVSQEYKRYLDDTNIF